MIAAVCDAQTVSWFDYQLYDEVPVLASYGVIMPVAISASAMLDFDVNRQVDFFLQPPHHFQVSTPIHLTG
jgi:hypothetical protein